MDPLDLTYDAIDKVPEAFRELYTEQDGKAVLTNITGLKTEKDVSTVQEALRKERNDRSAADAAFKPWKAMGDITELQAKLDRIPELEAAAAGKLDDDAINVLVEGRLVQKTAPLERTIETHIATNAEIVAENNLLRGRLVSNDRNATVRAVAGEMKVTPSAMPDIEMVAANYLEFDETTNAFIVKADSGELTPGASVAQFMKEMQKSRPHWWPQSSGGGAEGGGPGSEGANNPWSAKSWSITAQGAYIRENGVTGAEKAAKSAGSFIGATRPAEATK